MRAPGGAATLDRMPHTLSEDHRLAEVTSRASVPATVSRLCDAARAAGMLVFARVDHGAGARDAGLQLGGEVVVLLGSPNVGTVLMQAARRSGLDLPLRVLVWDDDGTTRITWRDPRDLAAVHALDGVGDVLEHMSTALREVVERAR